MKKLLVLALLGLGLGAGAWKAQNPEGTLDDFRSQADATVQRLRTGVDAVIKANPSAQIASEEEQLSKQEELASRLTSVEEKLASTLEQPATEESSNALEELSSSIATIRTDVAMATAGNEASIVRLDAIDSRLELLVRRMDEQTVDSELQSVRGDLNSLTTDLENTRAAANTRESIVDNELATLTERNTALGLRLDTLNATAEALASSGDDAASRTDDSEIQAPALLALDTSIDERFNSLENRLGTVNSDSRKIAALSEQLAAANQQIEALQKTNDEAQNRFVQINESIASLRTAGESLSIDTVQAEIRQQLAQVQSQIENNASASNAQDLESLLDTTRNRIQTLEQRVQELPASSSEADNAQQIQSALESQIVDLEKRLESINSADPTLASTLSNVQEKVDELASKEFVTQEDLRAQKETRAVQYKIYFDRNSVDITGDAAVVLDSFITQEQNRTTGVSIFGFTDRRGSATYNQQLALQRATNVRSYLIQNGFDYTKIKALNGLGEDAAAAVLPDNADDAQQRVVVLYAAQP